MTTELRQWPSTVGTGNDVLTTDAMATSFGYGESNASMMTATLFSTATRPEANVDNGVQFAAIVSLSIAVAAGNILLVATVCRSKNLRSSVGNALIINLAVVDLASSIIVLPLFAATVLVGSPPGGQSVCTAVAVVTQSLFAESIVTLAAIGIDRYLNICHPLRYPRLITAKSMAAVIGMTWLYSLIVASVPLVGFGRYSFHGPDRLLICSVDYSSTSDSSGLERGYAALVLGTVVAPAVAAIAVVYVRIFMTARMQTRRIFDSAIAMSATSSISAAATTHAYRSKRKSTEMDPAASVRPLAADRRSQGPTYGVGGGATSPTNSTGLDDRPTITVVHVDERSRRQTSDGVIEARDDEQPVGADPAAAAAAVAVAATVKLTISEPTRSLSDAASRRRTWKAVVLRRRASSVSRVTDDTSVGGGGALDGDGEGRWLNALARIRKAMRQVRAARTVALIIGGFFICWTPYTVTTIATVLTGLEPAYDVNFAANFMAFAGGLVNPIVCLFVNRDFWTSFRILVGLRRRELMRMAARAFAEATAETEPAEWGLTGCRRRFISIESGTSSTDSSDWIVFRERWNELQTAAVRRHSSASATFSTVASARPSSSTKIGVTSITKHSVPRFHCCRLTCFGGNDVQSTSASDTTSDGLATISGSSELTRSG